MVVVVCFFVVVDGSFEVVVVCFVVVVDGFFVIVVVCFTVVFDDSFDVVVACVAVVVAFDVVIFVVMYSFVVRDVDVAVVDGSVGLIVIFSVGMAGSVDNVVSISLDPRGSNGLLD